MGFNNYRYFYNFLFWLWVGCLFLMCCTAPLILWPSGAQFDFLYGKDALSARGQQPAARDHEGLIFFTLVLTAAASVAVGLLLALHTYLTLTNQTTIEMYANNKKKAQAKRRGEVTAHAETHMHAGERVCGAARIISRYDKQQAAATRYRRSLQLAHSCLLLCCAFSSLVQLWFNLYDLGLRRNWLSVLGSSGLCGGGSACAVLSLCARPLGFASLAGSGLLYEINPNIAPAYYSQERAQLVHTV